MSLTIHSIPEDVPLHYGKLVILRLGVTRRPTLCLRWWCPHTRTHCTHELPPGFKPDLGAVLVDNPDREVPSRQIAVAVDPDLIRQARDAIRHHAERHRAWASEQLFQDRLAPPPRYINNPCSTSDWASDSLTA